MMWQTKIFKTKTALQRWICEKSHRYQWDMIYVNNGWGVEYRKLKKIH